MALSTLVATKTNTEAGFKNRTGSRTVGFVTVSVTSQNYVAGGLDMDGLFIDPLGISKADQVLCYSLRGDNQITAGDEIRARWDKANQKLILYEVMGGAVQESGTIALDDFEFDLKVIERNR